MSLDFTPRPGAAKRSSMLFSQTRMELKLLLRNGEQMLITLVIPIMLLIVGTQSNRVLDLGDGAPIDILTPGVFALAIMSSGFTSLAIATGFERRYGVLKRLGASPLSPTGLIIGKLGAVAITVVIQLVVLAILALLLGWSPQVGIAGAFSTLIVAILGTITFVSLGMLIAGVLRAEATLAVANLVYVALIVGGAVIVPLDQYPDAAQPIIALTPSAALSEGFRSTFESGTPGLLAIAVLLAWAAAAIMLAVRCFRWE